MEEKHREPSRGKWPGPVMEQWVWGAGGMNRVICEVGQVEGPACFWMEVFMIMCYVHVIAFIAYVESRNTVC